MKSSQKEESTYITSFEIPIRPGFSNEEYVLKWDIAEIEKHIERKAINSQEIKVNNQFIWSCPSRLNKFKLSQMSLIPEIQKPIILAFHSGTRQLIVIDGNHRFQLKNKNRKK